MSVFGNLFTWLGTFLSALWAKAEPDLVNAFKAFVLKYEVSAIAIVQEAAKRTDITGAEKFSWACAQLLMKLETDGVAATTTAIQTLMQDAVAAWKVSTGQPLV